MQRSKFRIPVIAAAALAVVGATPADQAVSIYPNDPGDTPQRAEATVLVRNHNSLDVEIVAVTEAVKTQPLSANAGGEIVLQVRSPLASSYIDRGPSAQMLSSR